MRVKKKKKKKLNDSSSIYWGLKKVSHTSVLNLKGLGFVGFGFLYFTP
jgi:hypothetical protein